MAHSGGAADAVAIGRWLQLVMERSCSHGIAYRRVISEPVAIGPGRTATVLSGPMALRSEVCGLTDGVVVSHRFAVA